MALQVDATNEKRNISIADQTRNKPMVELSLRATTSVCEPTTMELGAPIDNADNPRVEVAGRTRARTHSEFASLFDRGDVGPVEERSPPKARNCAGTVLIN